MEYRIPSKILLELQPKDDEVGIRLNEDICQRLSGVGGSDQMSPDL